MYPPSIKPYNFQWYLTKRTHTLNTNVQRQRLHFIKGPLKAIPGQHPHQSNFHLHYSQTTFDAVPISIPKPKKSTRMHLWTLMKSLWLKSFRICINLRVMMDGIHWHQNHSSPFPYNVRIHFVVFGYHSLDD